MDAIIRSAAVSQVAFELRRPGQRPAAAPAPAPAPAAAAAAPVPPPVPAPVPAPAPAPSAAPSVTAAPAQVPVKPAAAPAAPPAPAPAAAVRSEAAIEEAVRLKVQAELAELRAEAQQRGYAAGVDKGEAEARRQLQSQIERVQGLAAQLAQARAAVLEDAEDGAVELAFAVLCRILGEQAATREGVLAMVERVAGARSREQVTVRLHPDDFALLGTAVPHPARFTPDAGIALGGCIVDSSTGSLDARLETQLARVAETLARVRAARRADGRIAEEQA